MAAILPQIGAMLVAVEEHHCTLWCLLAQGGALAGDFLKNGKFLPIQVRGEFPILKSGSVFNAVLFLENHHSILGRYCERVLFILSSPPIPGKTTLESNGLKFAITQGNDVKTNPVTLGRFSKIFALYLEILTGLGRIKNVFALTGGRDINGSNNGRKENKFFHNVQVIGAHRSNMPRTGKAQK